MVKRPRKRLLALCLLCAVGMSTWAQRVSFKINQKPLKTAVIQFKKATGYSFVFGSSNVNMQKKVTVNASNQPLSTVVDQMLEGQNVDYEIQGKLIVLKEKKAQNNTAPSSTNNRQQQARKITGTVVDNNGDPVIGATIKLIGAEGGTVTDIDGNFELRANPGQKAEVSYVGFDNQTITLSPNTKVTLKQDVEELNEVVVVGYGTVRKADLAGSVSIMDNKSFRDQPVTTITDALQGRVSGVNVTTSGGPGGDVKIRVRGAGSINRSNDPLYVVDGMVREAGLEGMDPEDIESIQVLKDASSTAIYGSRGANGVVIVTTKTGTAGKSQIIFDANVGIGNVAKRLDLLSAYDFATAYNVAHPGVFNESQLSAFKNGTAGTDWQDEMYRTAVTQNYKLVASGGNEKTQYYVSGNYMNNQGVIINTDFTRYQFKANVKSAVKPWLDITADIDGSYNKGQASEFSAGKSNAVWVMMNFAPVVDLYDADGNFNLRDTYSALTSKNPVAVQKQNHSQFRRANLSAHVDLRFKILKELSFTTSNGVSYRDTKGYSFEPSSTSVLNTSTMSNNDWEQIYYQSTNNLTYLGNWGKHHLTATGVWEVTHSTTRQMGLSGSNLLTEAVGWWNYNLATTRSGSNGYSSWALLSGVARAIYNYDDRYLLTATFRADGSSKFTNKKWGYFPSVAVAWNLGNEKFMQKQNAIQNAKIRVSYGTVGSQAIEPYGTLGILQQTTYSFDSGTDYTGYWIGTSVATPDLTWEKSDQFDLGIEFGILKNRVRFTFDYFNRTTRDGLLQRSMPAYDGGGEYWVNAAKVKNNGFEFSIDANPIETKDFSWTTALTGSYLKNEVKDLGGISFIAGSCPAAGMIPTDGVTRIEEGYPIGTFYVYKWAGLNSEGRDTYYTKDGEITEQPSSDDRIMTGQAMPKWTMGWNNTLTYKNWTLNMFFNSAFGGKRIDLMRFTGCSINGDSYFITWQEAWDKSYGQSTNPRYPAVNVTGNNYLAASTKWLESNDYLRLENITLSYRIPRSVTHFADIVLSANAQNLFTITGYKGQDPAGISRIGSGSVDANDGIDMGAYPRPRSFSFGARFTF